MDSLKYISTKTFEVLKQQQEEPNVKPAFCHQTPPTPKVGEVAGIGYDQTKSQTNGFCIVRVRSAASDPGLRSTASPTSVTPPTSFPEVPQMPPDQKAPPPQGLSALEVEQQIQEHLNTEPTLANTKLGVEADESSVILTGTVESDLLHDLALRIVRSYACDRKLVDKVQVPQ
jgi:hypothetical protein